MTRLSTSGSTGDGGTGHGCAAPVQLLVSAHSMFQAGICAAVLCASGWPARAPAYPPACTPAGTSKRGAWPQNRMVPRWQAAADGRRSACLGWTTLLAPRWGALGGRRQGRPPAGPTRCMKGLDGGWGTHAGLEFSGPNVDARCVGACVEPLTMCVRGAAGRAAPGAQQLPPSRGGRRGRPHCRHHRHRALAAGGTGVGPAAALQASRGVADGATGRGGAAAADAGMRLSCQC